MLILCPDSGYMLQTGRVGLADKAANLLNNEQMRKAHLGW
jgi:ABC-type branched-subunit amino acid transport system ATPase component